jgi:hypothetical protein
MGCFSKYFIRSGGAVIRPVAQTNSSKELTSQDLSEKIIIFIPKNLFAEFAKAGILGKIRAAGDFAPSGQRIGRKWQ